MGLFYNIGKLVKEKREEKGLSQRKLAELADVSHTEISRIESGERKRPAPYILKRVAPHLGVKYEELLEAAGYEELVVEKPFSPKPDLIIKEHSAQYISAVKDFIDETLTGLREGELRGLTWPAVDLENCRISVLQTVRGEGKTAIYGEPKTEESIGAVTFDPSFVPLFEQQRRKQMEDMEKCSRLGIKYNNRHLVFATYTGNPIRTKTIYTNFEKIIEAAGVRKIRFHDLRHSCATLLIAEGVPLKVVQERLRHADIRTTGNIYSHVLPKMQEEANAKMGKILKLPKSEKERQKERQNKKATQ